MEVLDRTNILQKHIKYIEHYKKDILYWGLGIENEMYLEFDKKILFDNKKFISNHKKERYSVDYYNNYKKDSKLNIIDRAFSSLINMNLGVPTTISMPLLMNSFSLTKTDKNNNSSRLYTKLNEENPKFNKQLLTEFLFENNSYLKENFDKTYTYDGDVIEIITLNFFNTTLNDVMNELATNKNNFITNIQKVFKDFNIYSEYGTIDFMKENYPFCIYLTNLDNVGIFNNGTLHFNITLPTILDKNGNIENQEQFISVHKKYIRLIQFMEPLLITIYGTPDPFSFVESNDTNFVKKYLDYSNIKSFNHKFSSSSQRCAISRYIGIGTYDTDIMQKGKIVTCKIEDCKIASESYGWYYKYYKECAYNKLNNLGYDINFNKHLNHGVEIRFFDHISSTDKIKEAMEFLIYLGDFSIESNEFKNPITDSLWNDCVIDSMLYGKKLNSIKNFINCYNELFNHKFISSNLSDLYSEIFIFLKRKSQVNKSPFLLSSKTIKINKGIVYIDI